MASIIKCEGYLGPERRREARRLTADRREMLRYEPDKEVRRSGRDRRRNAAWSRLHTI